MERTQRKRLRIAAAISLATALGLSTLAATPSVADVPSGSNAFASASNASDPYIYKCANGGYCMVTSQDAPNGTTGKYPMNKTLSFTSPDGLTWSAPQTAINESQLASIGAQPANHLWAPTVRFIDFGSGPDSTRFESRLIVPALTNASNPLSSRIFLSRKMGSGNGGYTPVGQVTGGTGTQATAYMSDPEEFGLDGHLTSPADDYLLWANGDGSTCGDLSIRQMISDTALLPYSTREQAQIVINGITGPLGTCKLKTGLDGIAAGTTVQHPYVEGGSLFEFSYWNYAATNPVPGPYTLVFAAKPTNTPTECTAAGQPNTANEVLAYATSSSVTGPYQYQGIIMCGSSTEWTNQATIEEVQNTDGTWRLVLVYHDGPAGANNRKLHSEVLYTDNNGKFINTQRSAEGAVSLSGVKDWGLNAAFGTSTFAWKAPNGKFVTSNNGALSATANAIGPWEQFGFVSNVGGAWFSARHERKWVQANQNSAGKLMATGAAPGSWENFQFLNVGWPNIKFYSRVNGKYVTIDSTGKLIANGTAAQAAIFQETTLANG